MVTRISDEHELVGGLTLPPPEIDSLEQVDPIDALRRIAYLLETDRAESYKVRAFRRAAATVAEMDPEVLARRASSGRLTDLPGVGDTTARVIAEAVAGETPAYLRHLEEQERLTLTGRAAELRGLLRGDCHSHSDWSDGGSPIAEMAEAAAALGHEYLALTDHSPRLTVAHGLDAERLQRQLEVLEALNEDLAPFRILSGIEVDILEDGSLDQDPALLAIESPHTDILGHCTGRIVVGRGRPQSRFDHHAVFEACARTGTAVEINSRPERLDPPDDLLRAAITAGCLVSIDTDAHAPGQLEWLGNGCVKAADAEVQPERLVNSWPRSQLLEWASQHGAAL
jgi:putative hydrolase